MHSIDIPHFIDYSSDTYTVRELLSAAYAVGFACLHYYNSGFLKRI